MSDHQDKTENNRFSATRAYTQAFAKHGGQNAALASLMRNKVPVSIFLIAGGRCEGIICGFDQFTISILDSRDNRQLIYKDKISSVMALPAGRRPRHPGNDPVRGSGS